MPKSGPSSDGAGDKMLGKRINELLSPSQSRGLLRSLVALVLVVGVTVGIVGAFVLIVEWLFAGVFWLLFHAFDRG